MNTLPPPAFRLLRLSPHLTVRLPARRCVVVLAPHPDDETLGCGLLVARLVRSGVAVTVVALSDGDASHPGSRLWPPARLAKLRRGEMRRALARLGAGRAAVHFMGWPDGQVAGAARQARLAALCHAAGAGLILATSPVDHHADHRACFAVATAVAKALRLPLVSYAVWSRLAGLPRDHCRDPQVAAKNWAAAAHRSQLSDYIVDSSEAFRLSPQDLRRFVYEPERYSLATKR